MFTLAETTPMPLTQLIAIRHGETSWNRAGRYQGQEDIALNDAGFAQARDIAQALADTPLDALYTSDLRRAYQTAAELALVAAVTPIWVPGLREQHFGVFQGLTGSEIAQRWPQASALWHQRAADFGPHGGESRNAFSQRCVASLERLAQAHPGASIAVVCHGGVLDCLYRAALGLPMDVPRTWTLENASINRLTYGPDGFALVQWGDTSHLQRAAADDMTEHFPAP